MIWYLTEIVMSGIPKEQTKQETAVLNVETAIVRSHTQFEHDFPASKTAIHII